MARPALLEQIPAKRRDALFAPEALSTADRVERLLSAMRGGSYRDVAAEFAGFDPRVVRRWLARGRKQPRSVYGAFRDAVVRAERAAEVSMAARVLACANAGDAKAAQWYLERRRPERWGRRDRIDHAAALPTGRGNVRVRVQWEVTGLDPLPAAIDVTPPSGGNGSDPVVG